MRVFVPLDIQLHSVACVLNYVYIPSRLLRLIIEPSSQSVSMCGYVMCYMVRGDSLCLDDRIVMIQELLSVAYASATDLV